MRDDDFLCRVEVLDDEQLRRLEARPRLLKRLPGLGWIAAIVIRALNGGEPAPPGPDRRIADRRRTPTAPTEQDRRWFDRRGRDRRLTNRRPEAPEA